MSLFWVSAVIAAIVFVAGLAAAWFALAGAAGLRRKLEAELQSTYERLREAEARRAAEPASGGRCSSVVACRARVAADRSARHRGRAERRPWSPPRPTM